MQLLDSIYSIVGPVFVVALLLLIIYSIFNPPKKEPLPRNTVDDSDFDNITPNTDQDRASEWKQQEELRQQMEEKRKREQANFIKQQNDEIYYSQVLGLKGKVSKSEIKKAYRELVAQYHPDKVQHLGSELQALANKKTKEIINAYEYFKAKYNL